MVANKENAPPVTKYMQLATKLQNITDYGAHITGNLWDASWLLLLQAATVGSP